MSQIKKWEKISFQTIVNKYGRGVESVIYKLPSGEQAEYHINKEGPACAVFALTKDNKVIVNRQYRPGPDEIMYDLPGGFIDVGEDPETAIRRELLEETGFAGEMTEIAVVSSSSYSTMKIHCFVATNCEKVADPKLPSEELIELELLTLEEFRKLLKTGQCGDVHIAYLGLDHLNLLNN